MSLYARIAGIGNFLPERVLTNQDIEAIVDTSDEWIRERTGIRKRHLVTEGERCSRLAEIASRRAPEDAGIDPATLDLIVVATTTPDQVFPGSACMLQQPSQGGGPIHPYRQCTACAGCRCRNLIVPGQLAGSRHGCVVRRRCGCRGVGGRAGTGHPFLAFPCGRRVRRYTPSSRRDRRRPQ